MRRDRIRARARTFYENLLERLNSIQQAERAPAFALEHSWHAIFVRDLRVAKLCQRPCCTVYHRSASRTLKLAHVYTFCTSGRTEQRCCDHDCRASHG